jgi:exodeoxyribonuclease V alpha subunit
MRTRKKIVDELIKLGFSKSIANKSYLQWGSSAISTINQDPYSTILFESKCKWQEIDTIARNLGFDQNSTERIIGAIRYSLLSSNNDGHVFLPKDELLNRVSRLIRLHDEYTWQNALEKMVEQREILSRQSNNHSTPSLYLQPLYRAEKKIANLLNQIFTSASKVALNPPSSKDLRTVEKELQLTFAQKQREAVIHSLTNKITIITGGPGTGKTTIIRAVISLWKKREARIKLAAPTGRAAKRMTETTHKKAFTIHRLLEYNPDALQFMRNENKKLKVDLLVVDEASMIDTELMASLLAALPPSAHLLLVGDVDQLPSVGPGTVLSDLIESNYFLTVHLNEIFRQSEGSLISINAKKINIGEIPNLDGDGVESGQDFFFVNRNSTSSMKEAIVELVTNRIPNQFGFNPKQDIQVLSPMYKYDVGVDELNSSLQKILNPSESVLEAPYYEFSLGDKVMQTKNDYSKDVFNGDLGYFCDYNPETRETTIDFEGRHVLYQWNELDNTSLAYAITVHKSQGSEYPAVVFPLCKQHYPMLQRNLLYTAVSRGKKLVVVVGDQQSLETAVRNNKIRRRYTGLQDFIYEAFLRR